MKKTTLNSKIKFLQTCLKEGYASIKSSTAENEGFDLSKPEIKIGNFRLKRDILFGGYNVSLLNNAYDLDNKPINENLKAFKYLQSLLQKGNHEISMKDLADYNIVTDLDSFSIGNIKLEKEKFFKSYSIRLSDKLKTSDGKWKDNTIDFSKVMKALQSFVVSESAKTKEVKINSELELHLRKYFENAHKSTGPSTGYFDLVIGNMEFVIEIKMSRALIKSNKRYEASGQIKQYLKQYGSNNFLLLVFGPKEDEEDRNLLSLKNEVVKEYKCYYHFFYF